MRSALCIVVALCSLPVFGERAVISLVEGNSLDGVVIHERPQSIYVDLGFTVLEIPRDKILGIESKAEPQLDDQASSGDALYQIVSNTEPRPVDEWVERYGESVVLIRTPTGLGSGFVVHPSGYLVTNDHVIAGEHQISVTIFRQGDGALEREQYSDVRIIATNSDADLALLKVELPGDRSLRAIPLGESNNLKQGQPVFAIGSPLGLDRSVSQGIVSNRNRPIGGRVYVQTTAEISPGNSGGPLFNLQGEVIGVNNMKVVAMGAEGLGFAIPANVLKFFLENRDAFAFDPRNPNAGFRYNSPPTASWISESK